MLHNANIFTTWVLTPESVWTYAISNILITSLTRLLSIFFSYVRGRDGRGARGYPLPFVIIFSIIVGSISFLPLNLVKEHHLSFIPFYYLFPFINMSQCKARRFYGIHFLRFIAKDTHEDQCITRWYQTINPP
jgi:hypothetical protein